MRRNPVTGDGAPATSNVIMDMKTCSRFTPYDLTRPKKIAKNQIIEIQAVHAVFARLTSSFFSSRLQMPFHVQMSECVQIPFAEHIRQGSDPGIFGVIDLDPPGRPAIIEITPPLASAMLDRLFGGQGTTIPGTREMSDFELAVMERIFVRFLGNLREAWRDIFLFSPRLSNLETSPLFAQVTPSAEMTVSIGLQAHEGDAEGMIRICYPCRSLENALVNMHTPASAFDSPGEIPSDTRVARRRKIDIASPICEWNALASLSSGQRIKIDGIESDDMQYAFI